MLDELALDRVQDRAEHEVPHACSLRGFDHGEPHLLLARMERRRDVIDRLNVLHRARQVGRVARVAKHGFGGAQRLQRLEVAGPAHCAHLLASARQQWDQALALVSVRSCHQDH